MQSAIIQYQLRIVRMTESKQRMWKPLKWYNEGSRNKSCWHTSKHPKSTIGAMRSLKLKQNTINATMESKTWKSYATLTSSTFTVSIVRLAWWWRYILCNPLPLLPQLRTLRRSRPASLRGRGSRPLKPKFASWKLSCAEGCGSCTNGR